MPIVYQDRILRHHLRANPNHYFVFGDNFQHRGYGGQAREMRGEPNAIGLPTKNSPYKTKIAFFSDKDYDYITAKLEPIFAQIEKHLKDGKFVILPSAGLGTGLAELPTRAPNINAFIQNRIQNLQEQYNKVELNNAITIQL